MDTLVSHFGPFLKSRRQAQEWTQQQLAESSGVHQTTISQLERGLKIPTLDTLIRIANAFEKALSEFVFELEKFEASTSPVEEEAASEVMWLKRTDLPDDALVFAREGDVRHELVPDYLERAIVEANRRLRDMQETIGEQIPVFEILGLRNLSSFVGEVFKATLASCMPDILMPNPHQDGYPDLLALTPEGKKYINEVESKGLTTSKGAWSSYAFGGVEVKATCGTTPPASSGTPKPGVGDTRIALLKSLDWKAHHRKTNHLIGLFWDFVDGLPSIRALFFRPDLTEDDWGAVVAPRQGGGHTTSVSVMTRSGVRKMGDGWIILPSDFNERTSIARACGFHDGSFPGEFALQTTTSNSDP